MFHSSVKAEYRVMAHTVCEMMLLKPLLWELEFSVSGRMPSDNQAAIYKASNYIFYERTKHIEVECHFVRDASLES